MPVEPLDDPHPRRHHRPARVGGADQASAAVGRIRPDFHVSAIGQVPDQLSHGLFRHARPLGRHGEPGSVRVDDLIGLGVALLVGIRTRSTASAAAALFAVFALAMLTSVGFAATAGYAVPVLIVAATAGASGTARTDHGVEQRYSATGGNARSR